MIAWVPGNPKTKGSMEHVGRGKMRESVVGSTVWRRLMAERFRGAAGFPAAPFTGAIEVTAIFYLPVPDVTAARAGDVDKLTRNLLDALQDAGVVKDDVQVTKLVIEKLPAILNENGGQSGAWVRVTSGAGRVG